MTFKKGASGNPNGRPKLTPQEKFVNQLTRETWNDLSQKMMTCTKEELAELLSGPEPLPMEVEIFIQHMLALAAEPDWTAYEKYLARRIGPVKQEIDLLVSSAEIEDRAQKLLELHQILMDEKRAITHNKDT